MSNEISDLKVDLHRDLFLRELIRELSGTLEDVVGLEEASGFISIVGQNIGKHINISYRKALNVSSLNKEQVIDVLIDLKKRIQGDFYLISENENSILLGNRTCPFADQVKDRESLCMMTSNVFGTITAENIGYGKVSLDKTIARGDTECRITVYFSDLDDLHDGREYFKIS